MRSRYRPNVEFRGVDLDTIVLDCCGATGEVVYETNERTFYKPAYDAEILKMMPEHAAQEVLDTLYSQTQRHYDRIINGGWELFTPESVAIELLKYKKKLSESKKDTGLSQKVNERFSRNLNLISRKVNRLVDKSTQKPDFYTEGIKHKIKIAINGLELGEQYTSLNDTDVNLLSQAYRMAIEFPERSLGIATADKMIIASHFVISQLTSMQDYTKNVRIITRPYLERKVIKDLLAA